MQGAGKVIGHKVKEQDRLCHPRVHKQSWSGHPTIHPKVKEQDQSENPRVQKTPAKMQGFLHNCNRLGKDKVENWGSCPCAVR